MFKEKNKIIYTWLIVITLIVIGGFFYLINQTKKWEKEMGSILPTGITTPVEVGTPEGVPLSEEEIKKRLEEKVPTEEAWKETTVFTGTGNQKTDTFFVPSWRWKMIMELERDPQKSAFVSIDIYRAENNELFKSISGSIPTTQSSFYTENFIFPEGKDSFYLDITPTDIDSWTIKVEVERL